MTIFKVMTVEGHEVFLNLDNVLTVMLRIPEHGKDYVGLAFVNMGDDDYMTLNKESTDRLMEYINHLPIF